METGPHDREDEGETRLHGSPQRDRSGKGADLAVVVHEVEAVSFSLMVNSQAKPLCFDRRSMDLPYNLPIALRHEHRFDRKWIE